MNHGHRLETEHLVDIIRLTEEYSPSGTGIGSPSEGIIDREAGQR
jgi:hypothetical protein